MSPSETILAFEIKTNENIEIENNLIEDEKIEIE